MKSADDACREVLGTGERIGRGRTRRTMREAADRIFTDALMIGLGLLMVPAVVLPLFFDLPAPVLWFLSVVDSVIIGIFIVEYVTKISLAEDRIAYATDPWHVLDLLIIVLPLLEYALPFPALVRSSPVLRVLRLARVAAIGGRSVDRQAGLGLTVLQRPQRERTLRIRAASGWPLDVVENLTLEAAAAYRARNLHSWIDVTGAGRDDYAAIARAFDLPEAFLLSALETEPFPSADRMDGDWLIVLREPYPSEDRGSPYTQTDRGRLVRLSGSGIVSIAPVEDDRFDRIAALVDESGDRTRSPLEHAVLSAIIRSQIEMYEQHLRSLERSLVLLEDRRPRIGPRRFLRCIYRERRQANRLVNDLFHIRAVVSAIVSSADLPSALSKKRTGLFGVLPHRIEFLYETASNTLEGYVSLIELHINDQSYEMNSVMKVIALITAITLVPTLVGQMLGMNLLDSPWPFYLWQILVFTLAVMIAIAYLFRQLGWMR